MYISRDFKNNPQDQGFSKMTFHFQDHSPVLLSSFRIVLQWQADNQLLTIGIEMSGKALP